MISVNKLTKIYRGYSRPTKRIWTALSFGIYKGDLAYPALEEISFHLAKGEILGVIGRNGAGKSTLLKILTGVSSYDSGSVKVRGSIRSLLELGVGFNPELTGRENLYYNGLIYGFTARTMKDSEDEIFHFANLEEFKDIPLKNYSSGMNVRLGFSLATFIRPDILLVDEALSVGDASFQQKSLKRIRNYVEEGTSVIVVSHDLHLLSSICTRIIVLEKGKLIQDSNPRESLGTYMELLSGDVDTEKQGKTGDILKYYTIELENSSGLKTKTFLIEEEMVIRINFELEFLIENLTVGFHIEDSRGIRVFGTNSYILKKESKSKQGLEYSCSFQFPIRFREGKYALSVAIHKGDSHIEGSILWKEGVLDFEVERLDLSKFEGLVHTPVECKWD